jgi:DNA-binding response OmpR family regulator
MTGGKRILIVDDDAFIRRPLEFILREEGYESCCASDAEEGLHLIATRRPDLILLDVMMPGKDGLTLCRELKADPRTADIPVVLLSARGREDDREAGLALGALDFMTKPYSPHELKRRVREILSRA